MLTTLILTAACTPTAMQVKTNISESRPVKIPSTGDSTIEGVLYGKSPNVVILSNMDPNNPESWAPLIPELVERDYSVISYKYNRTGTESLKDLLDVLAFARSQNFSKIVLIGGSRGGVISIQAAARQRDKADIVAVAAISAPIRYDSVTFYSDEELKSITVPKLLIQSEGDESAEDTRRMHQIFVEPKKTVFYSGDAHGTQIFDNSDHRRMLVEQLVDFVATTFTE